MLGDGQVVPCHPFPADGDVSLAFAGVQVHAGVQFHYIVNVFQVYLTEFHAFRQFEHGVPAGPPGVDGHFLEAYIHCPVGVVIGALHVIVEITSGYQRGKVTERLKHDVPWRTGAGFEGLHGDSHRVVPALVDDHHDVFVSGVVMGEVFQAADVDGTGQQSGGEHAAVSVAVTGEAQSNVQCGVVIAFGIGELFEPGVPAV